MKPAALAPVLLLLLAAAPSGPPDTPYLTAQAVPDGLALLPPPPAPGSATQQRDRAVFDATRRLAGTPRWRLAAADVGNAPLDRYACAMGLQLDAATTPALVHLIDKIGTWHTVDAVKARYAVPRPFVDTDAPICELKTAHLAANGDYPSGHAANGWLEGLVLAQLLPARATQILSRARAYGESRTVCGSHSLSAVEAGWMVGSATFAALQASPGFRHDLAASGEELAAVQRTALRPDVKRCEAEASALAQRPW